MAQYVKVKLAEYNKKNLSSAGPSLNKKNDDGENCHVPDLHEQISSNADELVKLTHLKKSLQALTHSWLLKEKGQCRASSRLLTDTRGYDYGQDLIHL